MVVDRRSVGAFAPVLVALAFGACNVYDSSLLTGSAKGGAETGGQGGVGASSGNAGKGGTDSGGASGSSGAGAQGGTIGSGGTTSPEGGAAGDDTPTGGATTGGVSTGGATTGGGPSGGSAGSGGAAPTGGTAGNATGGAAGVGGAGGAGGVGNAGTTGGGAGGSAGASAGGGAGGAGGSGIVVQLTGTATADSSQTNPAHPASHGNDAMTATRWCAANSAVGHYWTLDLGAVHTLSRFEVMWEYPTSAVGLPYGYVISVSTDGTTFTTAIDRTTNTDVMQTQSSDFPPATTGRHVRITASVLPTGAWASFFEARVFGQ